MIKYSIVIPVYNGERYLKKCLDSIYCKSKKYISYFQVIIVNDGSTDNSRNIYMNYLNKYSNIVIIENANHGVSYSRNCGIDKALGKYILFLDCDDYFIPEWYIKIDSYIDSNDFDVVFFSKKFIKKYDFDTSKNDIISYIITYNKQNIRISGPYSKIFRREFLIDNSLQFDIELINAEDMLFNLICIIKSKKYLLINDSYYVVRHNKFSSTSKYDKRIINSEVHFNKEINKLFNNKEYDYATIKKYCFMSSVRTIIHRGSFIDKYKIAKKMYKEFINNEYIKENFKNYSIRKPLRSRIIYTCFKNKCFYPLYKMFKKNNNAIKEDWYELL